MSTRRLVWLALAATACADPRPGTLGAPQPRLAAVTPVVCQVTRKGIGGQPAGTCTVGATVRSTDPREAIAQGRAAARALVAPDARVPAVNAVLGAATVGFDLFDVAVQGGDGQLFGFQARITNLLDQPLGYDLTGASDTAGVRVFVESGPTADVGLANLTNPDGTGTGTGPAQPYFKFAPSLVSGGTATRRWVISADAGATTLTFRTIIVASVAQPYDYRVNGAGVLIATAAVGAGFGSSTASCATSTYGTAWCWGYSFGGANGTFDNADPSGTVSTPTEIPLQATTYVTGAGIPGPLCGIRVDNIVTCLGQQVVGSTPVPPGQPWSPSGSPRLVQLTRGGTFLCALDGTGTPWCIGFSSNGALGLGTATSVYQWTRLNTPLRFTKLAAMSDAVCGIEATAQHVYCWGDNSAGQLGSGTAGGSRGYPAPLAGGAGKLGFTDLAGGDVHACALDASGAAWCWGQNGDGTTVSGQTGDSTAALVTATPIRVQGGLTFSAIAAGQQNACGLQSTGDLYCWGKNDLGELGVGSAQLPSSGAPVKFPTAQFFQVSIGGSTLCGIRRPDGSPVCWGNNNSGQLGRGPGAPTNDTAAVAPLLPAGQSWLGVLVGGGYSGTSCAWTTSQRIWCWGYSGAPGPVLTSRNQYSTYAPIGLPTGTLFSRIAVGSYAGCGVTQAGGLSCWGEIPTGGPAHPPQDVGLPNAIRQVTAGYNHFCVLSALADSAAYCFGDNSYGQAGTDTVTVANFTVATPTAVRGGHKWRSIAAGIYHTCGVDNQGAVWCWGYNYYGQLGNGSALGFSGVPSPVQATGVAADTVVAGAYHTCALQYATGQAYCWGYNGNGQLGYNTGGLTYAANPPGAPIDPFRFVQLSAGAYTTCGRTAQGLMMCWGTVLPGDGSTSQNFTQPQVVGGGAIARDFITNGGSFCYVTPDQDLRCWGTSPGNGASYSGVPVRPSFPQGRGAVPTPPA